jgi:hypothetical protein
LAGCVTGYFVTHSDAAVLQTVTIIAMFFALHRLAAAREDNDQ